MGFVFNNTTLFKMKIAVLAKNHEDFNAFLRSIHCKASAAQNFVYIENLNQVRGVSFDALIETENAYKKSENYELGKEVLMRIRNE